jgi:hypothetical protein
MPRPAALLIPLLLATTAAAGYLAWQEHRQLDDQATALHKAALVASENDALRDALAAAQRKEFDAQNAIRRTQIEKQVQEIRGLKFKHPVVYQSLDRAGIRQVVESKLAVQYTDQEFQDLSTGYSAIGLLPPDFPLKQTFVNLLGEQIGAFYDQHQHQLFMFQDASLENAQNRVILAHELTHALQDQNFNLLNYALEIKDNDDREYAASALIEGDATLVMTQYMMQDMSWNTLSDTVTYSATQSMVQIRKAPRFLREMLVFPYLKGQVFCSEVFARGGFRALDEVYAHPPVSTSQILHPEKYFPESREDPIPITFPSSTTFNGEKPLSDNVVGEMAMRVLFSQYEDPATAGDTAAAWRGDRYLVFDKGNVLVWKSIWPSAQAAKAALRSLRAMCAQRYHFADTVAPSADALYLSGNGHSARIFITPYNECIFLLAPDDKTLQLLYDQFAGASHG